MSSRDYPVTAEGHIHSLRRQNHSQQGNDQISEQFGNQVEQTQRPHPLSGS